MATEKKKNKVLSIILHVLLYTFMVCCMIALIFTIAIRSSGQDAVSIFGHQIRIVISPSMEECEYTDVSEFEIKSLPVNSMVFIEEVPTDKEEAQEWYKNLDIGDVLTFKYVYVRQEVITHRIIDKKENGNGGYMIYLSGDNKNDSNGNLTQVIDTSASETSPNYVIGKVVGYSVAVGQVISFLSSTLGIVFVIIIPVVIIIVLEVIKLVKLLTHDKRQAALKKQQEQEEEIENLRKRLEMLENNANNEEGQES